MNKHNKSIFLRSAEVKDSELLALICESNIDLYDPIMPGDFKKQAKKFRNNGINAPYDINIIEKKGESVGFTGTYNLSKDNIYLVALYLFGQYQRQGIGHEVLRQIINQASLRGVKEILLLVHQESIWAIKFYKKNGFRIIGENARQIKEYDSGIIESYISIIPI